MIPLIKAIAATGGIYFGAVFLTFVICAAVAAGGGW